MSDWKLTNGRIVLFFAAPQTTSQISVLDIFRNIWGSDPDNFQKAQNPLAPSSAQGKRGSIAVSCSTQPVRIDFTFNPANSQHRATGSATTYPQISDSRLLRAEFERVIKGIADNTSWGPISRVALNANVQSVVPNFAEANQAITDILPAAYKVTLGVEEDFVLQVNQPFQSSTVEGIRLNMIRKWTVDRIQIVNIGLSAGGIINIADPRLQREVENFITSGCAIDVNSVNSNTKSLTSANIARLLEESLSMLDKQVRNPSFGLKGFHYD